MASILFEFGYPDRNKPELTIEDGNNISKCQGAMTIMDKPCFYEIHIEGVLTDCWSDWFEGLAIQSDPDGETTLSGPLSDQAALFGVLNKIYALNLTLISVNRSSHQE